MEHFQEFVQWNRGVDAHRGCPEDWLERHERACAMAGACGRAGIKELGRYLLQRTSDDRNGILAIEHLLREGGRARGPGELSLEDVAQDRFRCARALRDDI